MPEDVPESLDDAVRLWKQRNARIDALISAGASLSSDVRDGEAVSDYQFWQNGLLVRQSRQSADQDPLRQIKIQTYLMEPLYELWFMLSRLDCTAPDYYFVAAAIDRKMCAIRDLSPEEIHPFLRGVIAIEG